MFEIVMPSKNPGNVKAAVGALRDAGETAHVIIVWDGDYPLNRLLSLADIDRLGKMSIVQGQRPFCYARNANIGIANRDPESDVVLMNDDIVLLTAHGLKLMASCAAGERWGILSPRVQGPANPIHMWSAHFTDGVSPVGRMVPFACVYIRRAVLEDVGSLDERFVPGAYEDDDYCRRAKLKGFRIGVANGCVVDHETLPHTFRPAGGPQLYDLAANQRRYLEKWGNLG